MKKKYPFGSKKQMREYEKLWKECAVFGNRKSCEKLRKKGVKFHKTPSHSQYMAWRDKYIAGVKGR